MIKPRARLASADRESSKEVRDERQDRDFRLRPDGPGDRRAFARGRPRGRRRRSATRRADLPKGATFVACDALDRDARRRDGRAWASSSSWRSASLPRRGLARGLAEGDRQFRRRLGGDRRAHGVHRQPLHVRAADGAARRDHAAHGLRREARGARGCDPRSGWRPQPRGARASRRCARPTSTGRASA